MRVRVYVCACVWSDKFFVSYILFFISNYIEICMHTFSLALSLSKFVLFFFLFFLHYIALLSYLQYMH